MSEIRRITHGIAWTTFGTIADKVLILINIFIILSYLSVYEYGLAELVFSVVSTIGIITVPGLFATIISDMGVERGKEDRSRMKTLFVQYLLLSFSLGLIAFLLLFFGASIAASLSGNASIRTFMMIVAFTFLVAPFRNASILIATVEARFVDQALYSIVEEIAKMALLFVFFFVVQNGPQGLFYAYVFAPLIAACLFLPRTISGYSYFASGRAVEGWRFWKLFGTHRKWSIVSSYIGTTTQNLTVWIIRILLGTEAVGIYAFASGILSNISSLLPIPSVFASIAPRYEAQRTRFIAFIRITVKLQFILSIIITVAAIAGLPVLAYLFPKYRYGFSLVLIMLLVCIPTATSAVFTPSFAILKRQYAYVLTSGVKLALTAVILPLSIFLFGLLGIGVGAILINTISGVERYVRLRRALPGLSIPLWSLITFSKNERVMSATLLRNIFNRRKLTSVLFARVEDIPS